MFKHDLGKKAKDKITGFEGIITERIEHLYGCNTYGLTPQFLKDGKKLDNVWFDEGKLSLTGEGIGSKESSSDFIYELGREAKDVITGFNGIITARIEYLHSCNYYLIAPRVLDEGKFAESEWIPEGRINITGKGINPKEVQTEKPGGEFSEHPRSRENGK